MFLSSMIILFSIFILFYLRNFLNLNSKKKVFKTKKFITFSRKNFNAWMKLTKKERYNVSKKESIIYLNKRKILLEEIRNEYKKISKEKSNKKFTGN